MRRWPSRGVKCSLAAAALLLVANLAGDRLAARAAERRLPYAGPERTVGSKVAEGFALRKIMADRRWFEILQYSGDISFVLEKGKDLPRMMEAATDIDPRFVHLYSFGASTLMWELEQPAEAVKLLRKGMTFNPEEKRLKMYLAAIAYREGSDLAGEVGILEALVESPGSPFMLRRILANTYAKMGRYRAAARIATLVLETSGHHAERRWAAAKIAVWSQEKDR